MSYRRFSEVVFVLLLLFPALMFGGIEPWAVTIIELAVLAFFTVFIFRGLGRRRLKLHFSPLFIPLLAFFCLCAVQLAISRTDPFTSHNYPYTLYRYSTRNSLLLLLSYSVFFYTAIHSLRDLKQISRIIMLLGVFGFLFSLFSIVQKLSGTDSAYWVRKMPGKFYGSFFNPNNLSNYLMMIFLLSFGHIIYLVKKRSYKNTFIATNDSQEFQFPLKKNSQGSGHLPLFLFFLLIILAAIIYSGSRGSIIIMIFSSLVLFIISFHRRIPKAAVIGLLIVVLAGTVVLTVFWVSKQPIYSDGEHVEKRSDFELRGSIWRHSIKAIKHNPIFGTGSGTYKEIIQTFLPWDHPLARLSRYLTHAHNDYLELITDTGIVGFVLFIAFVVLFVTAVVKNLLKKGGLFARSLGYSGCAVMLAMGVHSLIDFNIRIPANGFLFAAVCAMTYFGLHYRKDGSLSLKTYRIRISRITCRIFQFITVILSAVMACIIALPLLAKMIDPVKEDVRSELARMDLMENQELFPRLETAIKLDLLNGFHRFHLAKAHEKHVRSLLSDPSGVVFDNQLYGFINSVFCDYRKTLEAHNTNGYYHMSLAFFAMLFVDYPEMADYFSPGIPLPELKNPIYDPTGDNVFFDTCYAHLQYAVDVDASNPNLHRGLYMGCFYLSKRVGRNGQPEIAEKLIALGKEECRKFLDVMPYYSGEDGKQHRSVEQALRYFARHISTDRDEMNSILPDNQSYRDYFLDKICREFVDEEITSQ